MSYCCSLSLLCSPDLQKMSNVFCHYHSCFLTYRLSRALHCFRDTCVRNKYRRHLKVALRILRNLFQLQPIERAWCCWQNTVRQTRSKAVFDAWVAVAQHQRRFKAAQQAVCASTKVNLTLILWTRWRTRAGASSLARLLNAWQVIGPVRRAIEVLREFALEACAAQHLQHRRLRCVAVAPPMIG